MQIKTQSKDSFVRMAIASAVLCLLLGLLYPLCRGQNCDHRHEVGDNNRLIRLRLREQAAHPSTDIEFIENKKAP
jgi:hypothetical protein